MQPGAFYQQILVGIEYSPEVRYVHYSKLHQSVLNDFTRAIRFIFEDVADAPPVESDEPRSIKLLVAHIAEWGRYALMSAMDILIGLEEPRMINSLDRYVDRNGVERSFESRAAFNAYCDELYADANWFDVQKFALDTADTIHALFTTSNLMTPTRLEATAPTTRTLPSGLVLEELEMGWVLWILVLEQAAVTYADALQLNR